MVFITEGLIRKRAEHNECIISTLEEVSLHQQDIEKIEHIGKWCRELKILYLQSNLIPKIENIGYLKKLDYINLALNNIERIENLEGCESLRKLDLTVNFVGELTSIECLTDLIHFRELYLTGNPCAQYDGYRDYVIATIPQLKYLDGTEIEKSERIKATQILHVVKSSIIQQQNVYMKKRLAEKTKAEIITIDNNDDATNDKKTGFDNRWYTHINEEPESREEQIRREKAEHEKEKAFWQETTEYTPESRVDLHKHMEKQKAEKDPERLGPDPPKRERRLQTSDGKILNVNEAQLDFALTEDGDDNVVLDLSVYKYLATSLVDADVQPTYVRVTVKGKTFQLVLPEEVLPDSSTAKRSEITGHLLVTMPKAKGVIKSSKTITKNNKDVSTDRRSSARSEKGREHLEVDPSILKSVDFANITSKPQPDSTSLFGRGQQRMAVKERENSPDFIDDVDVPPLM